MEVNNTAPETALGQELEMATKVKTAAATLDPMVASLDFRVTIAAYTTPIAGAK